MKRKQKNLLIILVCLLAVAVYLFMKTSEGFQSTPSTVYLNVSGKIIHNDISQTFTHEHIINNIFNRPSSSQAATSAYIINMLTAKEVWNSTLKVPLTLLPNTHYAYLSFPPFQQSFTTTLTVNTNNRNDIYIKMNGKNSYTSVLTNTNLMYLDGLLIKPTTNITFNSSFQSQIYMAYYSAPQDSEYYNIYYFVDVTPSDNANQLLNLFPTLPSGTDPTPRPGATLNPVLTPDNTYIILLKNNSRLVIHKTTTLPVGSGYTIVHPYTRTLAGTYVDALTHIPDTYTFTPLSEASASALEVAYMKHTPAFASVFSTLQDAIDASTAVPDIITISETATAPTPAPTPAAADTPAAATPAATTDTTAAATPAATPPAATAAVASNSPSKKKDNTLLYVSLGLGIPLVLGLVTVLRGG